MGLREDNPIYDNDLLWARCEKAKRVLFEPLKNEFQNDFFVHSEAGSLTVQTIVDSHYPSPKNPIWGKGLVGLQARLGEIYSTSNQLDMEALGHAFPPHQNTKWCGDPRYCARGLIHYLTHEFLGVLFLEGKIICLAEDSGHFSIVSYGNLFSAFSGSYDPPYEHDFWMPLECDEEDLRQSGADALWFAFTRDFAEIVTPNQPEWREVAAQCPEWSKHPTNSPFVQQVVALYIGEHLSAKAAAGRVVKDSGHSPRGSHIKGTVSGTSFENAVENLYRDANKVLRYLENSGVIPS